jgi:hypothetical protein
MCKVNEHKSDENGTLVKITAEVNKISAEKEK